MQKDVKSSHTESALASVSLPPLPARSAHAPGGALRLQLASRPPTPPPRPESSLHGPPPPAPVSSSTPASGPGRGQTETVSNLHSLHLPPSLSSLEAPSPISLTSPRSVTARAQNLYVDTPFKGPGHVGHGHGQAGHGHGGHIHTTKLPHIRSFQSLPNAVKSRTRQLTVPPGPHGPHTNSAAVITTPPFSSGSSGPTKPTHHSSEKSVTTTTTPGSPGSGGGSDSIICVICGRCRCTACATATPLPSKWLCDNSCLCSADALVDTISCMCCVKAAFYHCGEKIDQDADKEDSWVDSPCSCSHNKWWLRWGCLAFLSLPLPCLLCYPLLKGVTKGAEYCYQAAMRQGCQCPDHVNRSAPPVTIQPHSSLSSPTDSHKRLLG